MKRVALKGLAGRKLRSLLTALAIVLGVAMVSGTFILTDTMQKSFNGLFDASFEKTDAGFRITRMLLSVQGDVPGMDEETFQEAAVDQGTYVLVRTSNPSAGDFQDLQGVKDEAFFFNKVKRDFPNTRILGPNCPGLVTVGECNIGFIPAEVALPGPLHVGFIILVAMVVGSPLLVTVSCSCGMELVGLIAQRTTIGCPSILKYS